MLANPRLQWVLAALVGAVVALAGGMAGGFIERVETDDAALADEATTAAGEVEGEGAEGEAEGEPAHGIPAPPGADDAEHGAADTAADDHAVADASEGGETGAEPSEARSSEEEALYRQGYFDGQACALLDPDSGGCLSPANVISRLDSAYREGYEAARISLGEPSVTEPAADAAPADPPKAPAPLLASGLSPRIWTKWTASSGRIRAPKEPARLTLSRSF